MPAFLRIPSLLLALTGSACAARHLPEGAPVPGQVEVYQISVKATVHSILEGGAPANDALAAAFAPLADFSLDLDLVVGLVDARPFRDGSWGRLLWIDAATLKTTEDGVQGEPQPWGLAGRSVELRAFPDGELLRVNDLSHLAGSDRQGDNLGFLFPMLSPHPPPMQDGGEGQRLASWPMGIDAARGWRESAQTSWRHLGMTEDDSAFRLSYTGRWTGRGRAGPAQRVGALSFGGDVSGELLLGAVDHGLLRHDLHWTKLTRLSFNGEHAIALTQQVDYVASLRRVATDPALEARLRLPPEERSRLSDEARLHPAVADAAPLRRYLHADEIRAALAAQEPALATCVDPRLGGDWSGVARLEIGPAGAVSATVNGTPPGQAQSCIAEALSKLVIRAHDEDDLIARWGLSVAGGVLSGDAEVSIEPRVVALPGVLCPRATCEDVARALADAIPNASPDTDTPVQGSDSMGSE